MKAPVSPVVEKPLPPHPFDLAHGTDTGGYISSADLHGTSLSSLYVTAYYGVAPSVLCGAIEALPVRLEETSFVDLGCGKGRALLVAAEYPFQHVFGVEIAPELCEVARANVELSPRWKGRVSVLNQDATTVTYPDGPLVIFMFHPFLAPVLRRVLANLERQLRRSPRPLWLLYARNPRYTDVLDRFPFLREVSDVAYPLSAEDAAVDRFRLTHENVTLYTAELSE